MLSMRVALALVPLAAVGLVAAHRVSPAPAKAPAKPTYAKDVAPILNRSCVSCHRAGEVAPFSLGDYATAKKFGATMAAVTKSRQMPPWKAAAGYGEFQHENRLSEVEIQTIENWASTGEARGDKRFEPTPPAPPTGGWTLGVPDMVLQAKGGPYRLEADGADVYRNFVLENPSDKDLWVRAMDVHPGVKKVVHHVIVYLDAAHKGRALAAATKDGQEGYVSFGGGVGFAPSGALGGWAPGNRPYQTPTGEAFRVPPGADIILQVHYHKSGKPEADATQVGLYLAKEPINKEIRLAWIAQPFIAIPSGNKAYAAHKEYVVRQDVTLHTLMPHMHFLGHTMRARVVEPDGKEIPLIDVPNWDFNWQLSYALKVPLSIPKGSKIVVDATYDNSADNPNNPSSPPRNVYWGEATTDEMFLLIASYTVDSQSLNASH